MSGNDIAGSNLHGWSSPKPEAPNGSSTPSAEPGKINGQQNLEEVMRIKDEYNKRMSYLSDIPDNELSPEIKVLKNLVEILLFRGRELVAALDVKYKSNVRAVLGEVNAAILARYEEIKNINVRSEYQLWYTDALAVIRLVLSSRADDFAALYEYPAKRSKLTKVNFRIADAMRGHAIPIKMTMPRLIDNKYSNCQIENEENGWPLCSKLIETQCDILEAALASLTTSLSKIHLFVQRKLFNSELLAAYDLRANGFNRAAGAMAGAILKSHLACLAKARALALHKKEPNLYDYAQKLKEEGIIDTPGWSLIQRLGDLHNRCIRMKDAEPKDEEVDELFLGVDNILKTLF